MGTAGDVQTEVDSGLGTVGSSGFDSHVDSCFKMAADGDSTVGLVVSVCAGEVVEVAILSSYRRRSLFSGTNSTVGGDLAGVVAS